MAGLIASLRDTHHLDSNKESGFGLFDVMLTPKSADNSMSIILEFKHAKTHEDSTTEAKNALKQIDQLKYPTDLKRYPHIKKVLKVGLAFCEKSVISAYKVEDLAARSNSDIMLSQEYRDAAIDYFEDLSQEETVASTATNSTKKAENKPSLPQQANTEKKSKDTGKRARIKVIESSEEDASPKQKAAKKTDAVDVPKQREQAASALAGYPAHGTFGTSNYSLAQSNLSKPDERSESSDDLPLRQSKPATK
jgi:hypothetical protein